jgi:hypothetical protein
MSDAQRNKGGIWSKYSGLSKNARIALGVSLIVGGLAGPYIAPYLNLSDPTNPLAKIIRGSNKDVK